MLLGLIPLKEINKYLRSGISAHDSRLSLVLAQHLEALNALLSPALAGIFRKETRMSLEISHQLVPLLLLDLQGRLQSLGILRHSFSGFFVFHEDFIFKLL